MKTNSLISIAVILTAVSFTSCKKEIPFEVKEAKTGTIASSAASNKTIVVEDFTGVKCTWCPTGHRLSENYLSTHLAKMIIIATQCNYYGTPYKNQPDFRTTFSAALEDNAHVLGYPGGSLNRAVFSNHSVQTDSYMAMYMTDESWYEAADKIIAETAPVNIGIKTSFDVAARSLSAVVETFYTSTVTSPLYIHVAITESGLVASQIDKGVVNSKYVHDHVLRTYLTGQWGEQIATSTVQGTRTQTTYTFTFPANFNADKCKVIAFVSENKKNILNAAEVDVK